MSENPEQQEKIDIKTLYKQNLSELKKYYKIKDSIGKNWLSSASKVYLISRRWLKLWKKYVNKEYFDTTQSLKIKLKKNSKDEKKDLEYIATPPPTPISNSDILIELKSFYNDGDAKNPENFIIKQDFSMKKDIKMIHEDLWNFFYERYHGGPKLCYKQESSQQEKKDENEKSMFNMNKTEIKIIFLPVKSDIIGNDEKIKEYFDEKNMKSLFIEKDKLISDLFEKIIKTENNILNSNKNNFYGEKIKKSDINIWFCYLNDFSFPKLNLLMIDYYGKDALRKATKKNKNSKDIKDLLIKKSIDKLFLSPYNLRDFCEIENTKIDNIFPESQKPKYLIFIEKNNSNYFESTKIIEKECSYCKKEKKLIYSCSCNKLFYCSKKCKNRHFPEHISKCENLCLEPCFSKKNIFSCESICGLKNLGNTCYMNTALQCLNSCWELTNFFLRKNIEEKINKSNPLGYNGVLCKSYCNLLQHLWYGASPVYIPEIFLSVIGNLNEIFKGKNQQDAHEFLNFLVDGLHEDLNLVVDKPMITEEKTKNVKIKAIIEWLNFKRRNQSVLIKFFYGQFLSNISCPNPNCQNVITKFEPFMSVSVPLTPNEEKIEVICFFLFYSTNIKPIRIEMFFNSNCTIMALRNRISKILNVHPFSFVICKLDEEGKLKYILNYTQLISTTNKSKHKNEKPYFLMQIDPKIFNNYTEYKDIKHFKTKNFENLNNEVKNNKNLDDVFKTEDESGAPNQDKNIISYYQPYSDEDSIYTNNTDNNSSSHTKDTPKFGNIIVEKYGLNDNYILVPLFINCYSHQTFENSSFFMFFLILILDKNYTCEKIHEIVYNLFRKSIDEIDKTPDFDSCFEDFKDEMKNEIYEENDTYEFHKKSNYPYRLRYINGNKKGRNNLNKLLPYSKKKLIDFIDELYPKNNMNNNVDGTYFFLNENQRNLINNKNRDFQLEMTWLKKYKEDLYKKMIDYEGLKFTPKKPEEKTIIELTQCFDYFMKWENLDNYSYKCEACKTTETPLKKIQIYKCPYYLIIHLKRFIDEKSKINTDVNFPLRGLNLKDYVVDENDTIEKIYDLIGIMYHSGTLQYGHYYAVCYNIKHKKWFLYNDDRVTEVKESDIHIKDAYVLFYRRRGLENMVDLEKIYMKEFKDYNDKIKTIKKNAKKNKNRDNKNIEEEEE